MLTGLLDSQLVTLEPAQLDEGLYEVDISGNVDDFAEAAIRSLTGQSAG